MKSTLVFALLLIAVSNVYSKEVAFIGLTGEGAPAIENTFNRHFLEQLATLPDIHSLNTIEIANLRDRTSGDFAITSMSQAFFTSLDRFISDSTLVIWGKVKECTVKPGRFWVVGAGIKGTLTIELTVFNPASRQFVFIGDAKAESLVKKWFVLWWPVENAIEISSQERARTIDELDGKAVSESCRILSAVFLHETTHEKKKNQWPAPSDKKPVGPAKTPTLEKKTPPPGPDVEKPQVVDEEPVDFEKTDSTVGRRDSTKKK